MPFLAGNWKMFKTGSEAAEYVEKFKSLIADVKDRQTALAVPATALYQAVAAARGSDLIIGAQNLHWEKEGAFTGEISAPMISAAGASMVIIGHSERRQYFGDDDSAVAKKMAAALLEGLLAVVCVGESLKDRESGQTIDVLAKQLRGALTGFNPAWTQKLVLAYEPVWAIGTGKTATADEAQQSHAFIRSEVASLLGGQAADSLRILYGGSVKPDNAASLMAQPDIDGLLVGGASLQIESFVKIVRY
jgi:triosephosphate isomerase